MLFYIDYLDHVTSGTRNFNVLELRLRFDLLVFGSQELCISVPACIKMGDTTNLLKKLDDFWQAGKIRLQLDKKHNPRIILGIGKMFWRKRCQKKHSSIILSL